DRSGCDERSRHIPIAGDHPEISVLVRSRGAGGPMLRPVAGLVAKEPASRFTHAVFTAQFVKLQNDVHVMVIRFIHKEQCNRRRRAAPSRYALDWRETKEAGWRSQQQKPHRRTSWRCTKN